MREHEPVVSIASSQRAWAAQLLRFLSDHGGARLAGTVLTGDDALEQDFEVLVIDDIASYLSPRLVERIQRNQGRILGVYDGELGESAADRLLGMGVDGAVENEAGPEAMLAIITSLCDRPEMTAIPVVAPVDLSEPATERRLTAVIGGDVALDVALALGMAFTARRQSALIIDADTVNPSLAQRLSLPMVPNLLTGLDSLTQLRGRPTDSLQPGPEGTVLLTGLPRASEWDTIRAVDVVDLCEQLALMHAETIIKVAPSIEDLSRLGGREGRFEIGRATIRLATDLAYVSASTPVGLARTLGWIADARQLSDARIHVLFSDAPGSLFQRGELTEELTRSFVPNSITWLPADPRRARSAWNGAPVPKGPFQKAVAGLAGSLLSPARAGAA